jgi:hypothetical protein
MLKPIRIENIVEKRLTPVGSYMYGYYDKKETIYSNGQTRILVGKIPFFNKEPAAFKSTSQIPSSLGTLTILLYLTV